jgi:hypothetical protein
MVENMAENTNENVIKIEVPMKYAKKLGASNKLLNLLISDILNKYGVIGGFRVDYLNFTKRVLKILISRHVSLWSKMIEVEKTSYMLSRNLDKKILDEIEDLLISLFKPAFEEFGEIDFDIALHVILRELEKKNLLKKTGIEYGGGEIRDLDS